jgi:hypothetical protein
MKIEIILSKDINERCTGMHCFDADGLISKMIAGKRGIKGIVLIDNEPVKFYFSPMGMDGDIFTDNPNHRRLIKYLIPVYVANMIDEDEIIEGSQNVKRLESDLEYLASI